MFHHSEETVGDGPAPVGSFLAPGVLLSYDYIVLTPSPGVGDSVVEADITAKVIEPHWVDESTDGVASPSHDITVFNV